MKMVKILLASFLLKIALLSGGCALPNKDYRTPEQITVQVSDELMEALINEDTSKLKGLMCPKFQEEYEKLDEKIQGIFEFIEGDIISYETNPAGTKGSSTPQEGWVKKYAMPKIENVKTDNGKMYTITYNYYFVNKAEPELLGVSYINVVLNNGEQGDFIIHYMVDAEGVSY